MLLAASDSHADASAIIRDSGLTPVDKVVWLVLDIIARGQGADAVVPSNLELARIANVSDRETVSRALLTLRCRRWLTACQASWCRNGWQRSKAYVLHTRPLPIADTLYLDPHYRAFLKHAAGHRYRRVYEVARAALELLPPQEAASA